MSGHGFLMEHDDFNRAVTVNRGVFAERVAQIQKHGYTIEHDDFHLNADFCRFIQERLDVVEDSHELSANRKLFIEIAALASAAAERLDREIALAAALAAADGEPTG